MTFENSSFAWFSSILLPIYSFVVVVVVVLNYYSQGGKEPEPSHLRKCARKTNLHVIDWNLVKF